MLVEAAGVCWHDASREVTGEAHTRTLTWLALHLWPITSYGKSEGSHHLLWASGAPPLGTGGTYTTPAPSHSATVSVRACTISAAGFAS